MSDNNGTSYEKHVSKRKHTTVSNFVVYTVCTLIAVLAFITAVSVVIIVLKVSNENKPKENVLKINEYFVDQKRIDKSCSPASCLIENSKLKDCCGTHPGEVYPQVSIAAECSRITGNCKSTSCRASVNGSIHVLSTVSCSFSVKYANICPWMCSIGPVFNMSMMVNVSNKIGIPNAVGCDKQWTGSCMDPYLEGKRENGSGDPMTTMTHSRHKREIGDLLDDDPLCIKPECLLEREINKTFDNINGTATTVYPDPFVKFIFVTMMIFMLLF